MNPNVNKYINECRNDLNQYIDDIINDRIVVNNDIKKAVNRYLSLFKDDTIYFNDKKFERVLKFCYYTNRRDKDTGKIFRFKLINYQLLSTAGIFGFYFKESNERLVDEAFIFIAKKQAKSTYISVITLYCFIADGVTSPECYIIANTVRQSNDDLRIIKDIIDCSPLIRSEVEVLQYSIRLKNDKTSVLRCLAKDNMKGNEGVNASLFILDEIFGYRDSETVNWCRSQTVNRKNSLIFMISTAGSNTEGFLSEMLNKSNNVLNGDEKKDSFFCLTFRLDPEDDWKDEKNWLKPNPCLGVTVTLKKLQDFRDEAFKSKIMMNRFLNQHLNVFTNVTNDWIDSNYLEKVFKPLNIDDFNGQTCYLGSDFSSRKDLSAISILFYSGDTFYIFNKIFKTQNEIYNENKNRYKLCKWVDQGYIEEFPLTTIDYDAIVNYIIDISKRFKIKSMGYDSNNSVLITPKLAGKVHCNPILQTGFEFNFPLKYMDKLITDSNNIVIDDNPCVKWQFSNCNIRQYDDNNIKLIKNPSRDSIDSIVAIAESFREFIRHKYNMKTSTISANVNAYLPKKTE